MTKHVEMDTNDHAARLDALEKQVERIGKYLERDAFTPFLTGGRPESAAERMTRKVYRNAPEHAAYLQARFPANEPHWDVFLWDGHRWRYLHTDHDDQGEFDVLLGPATEPPQAEQIAALKASLAAYEQQTCERCQHHEGLTNHCALWDRCTDHKHGCRAWQERANQGGAAMMPTAEGYYWMRQADDIWRPIHVERGSYVRGANDVVNDVLKVWWIGWDIPDLLSDYANAEFSPLVPPEDHNEQA